MEEFHNSRIVTTRKPHRCEWCGKIIPAGMRSLRIAGRYEDFYHYRAHISCDKLISALDMDCSDGISDDGWQEEVRGAYSDLRGKDGVPDLKEFGDILAFIKQYHKITEEV